MKAELRWLDDPEIFAVNRVKAHSDHEFFLDKEGKSSVQSLDGNWKFKYSINAASRPVNFYEKDFDISAFDEIKVPSHIEMAGYDKVHYINTMYPWEAMYYRRPKGAYEGIKWEGMFSEADYNPVGSYVLDFDLDENLKNKDVRIRFEGVEQAFYLWVNGSFIGYSEDSFTMAEFDITDYVTEKNNRLAVEVHKRSTAAFLEDQDFFRFFGIFRSVSLAGLPKSHVEDVLVEPELDLKDFSGNLRVVPKITGEVCKINLKVFDEDNNLLHEEVTEKINEEFNVSLKNVKSWSPEHPYLYRVDLELYDNLDKLVEYVPVETGFRKIEIKDGLMLFNGERLIINGVNRHEWSPYKGRAIGEEEELIDIDIIKRNNINAVRTSHYPNRINWYRLCDKKGCIVMAETNLETHGSWQKPVGNEPSWNVPGDNSLWEAVTIDRAVSNYEMFKNHVSVLFWSLGNESYAGTVIEKMNSYFKEKDKTRLVHYEGVFHNPVYRKTVSDMESQMYTYPDAVEKFIKENNEKPFILCEYMHCMGNSLGGFKEYTDLIDKYPSYQGGFIWDFIDQTVYVKDEVTGQDVLRYGGDFDDRPSDYEFSANGIVFADRTEKPAMQEVRYLYGKYSKKY